MFKPSRNDPSAIVLVRVRGSEETGYVKYYEWCRKNFDLVHFHSDRPVPIIYMPRVNLIPLEVLPF